MNSVEFGEVLELDNGEEYVCFSCKKIDNNEYLYLINNKKHNEFKIAKYSNDEIIFITDVKELARLKDILINIKK